MTRTHHQLSLLALTAACAAITACGGGDGESTPPPSAPAVTGDIGIKTVSNRADMISDGDALTEITLPTGATFSDLKVTVGGTDVTSAFAVRPDGRILGVLTGLHAGENEVIATLTAARKNARLKITNFDRGGPIFSGPPIEPWVCATKNGTPTTIFVPGTTLSAAVITRISGLDSDPTDGKCNAPTKFSYYYQPKATEGTNCTIGITGSNPCFVQYSPAARPLDAEIADFTNDRGDQVKSMLRVELGTIDRTTYQIATYFDPAQPWSPWAPQKGWNGKLYIKFSGGATGNRFQAAPQGTSVFDPNALRAGFMVVNSQLTTHNQSNNELLTAEVLMMVKERVVDAYGEVRYTLSDGSSGGAMMQTVISSVAPGILNGLITIRSYDDAISTWVETRDCGILDRYYATPNGTTLTTDQRSAIEGKPNSYCNEWVGSFIQPQVPTVPNNCGSGFPASIVYDPQTRRVGVRCSIHDMLVNILGTAVDGDGNVKPKLPYDNTGVQYGLAALGAGSITAEQFVQLNEGVGSYDADMNWSGGSTATPTVPAGRFRALPEIFPQIYASGIHSNGANLANVSIIDLRPNPGPDIHMPWRSAQKRARLDAANGGHQNHIIRGSATSQPGAALMLQAFQQSDRWWTAIEADNASGTLAQKVIRNRPADANDGCFTTAGATTTDLATELSLTDASCPIAAPMLHKSPRQIAGGPVSEDVYKCQLKPLDTTSADYGGATFTVAQTNRLRAVFPDGVCDWTKPGVGQSTAYSFTNFMSGPQGTPVPAAPNSVPF